MNTCELYYFIGKCISLGEEWSNANELIHIIKKKHIDWDKFLIMSDKSLILPALYLKFDRYRILSYLPEDLAGHLRRIYELNKERNLKVLEQVHRINRLLATKGIVPVYLKSTGNLLENVYEDIGEKMFGDIDLLVSEREFLPAVDLLIGEGYEQNINFYEADLLMTKHYPRLIHPVEPADVEVHRVPVEIKYSSNFNYDTIKPGIRMIDTIPPCYVLSDQDKLILNLVHGFLSHQLSHIVSFRDMLDFIRIEKRLNISQIVNFSPKFQSEGTIYTDFVHHALGRAQIKQMRIPSRYYIRRYEIFLRSEFCYKLVWLISFLLSRLWSNYLMNLAGIFYSKSIRKFIFCKISDPGWLKRHLKFYRDTFRHNFAKF